MNQLNYDKHSPIGVFDSGLGGISVLRELKKLMPNEDYLYYGDSANAPYGVRTTEDVRNLTENAVRFLMDRGVKCIVIACNTATSAAAKYLREKYSDFIIVGLEPAIKPAVLQGDRPRVAVMATPVTLREEKFNHLAAQFNADAEIIKVPAPMLVEYVEKGVFSGPEIETYISSVFQELCPKTPDSVVLGCTHFPFVKNAIQKALKTPVTFYDGAEGASRETHRRLETDGLLNDRSHSGCVTFLNSSKAMQSSDLPEILLRS